jgi:hypothetical protein
MLTISILNEKMLTSAVIFIRIDIPSKDRNIIIIVDFINVLKTDILSFSILYAFDFFTYSWVRFIDSSSSSVI